MADRLRALGERRVVVDGEQDGDHHQVGSNEPSIHEDSREASVEGEWLNATMDAYELWKAVAPLRRSRSSALDAFLSAASWARERARTEEASR